MKSLVLLLLFISLNLNGQTPCGEALENWHLEKGNSTVTIKFQLPDNIKDSSILFKAQWFSEHLYDLKNVTLTEATLESIKFSVSKLKLDYKSLGYNKKSIVPFMTSEFDCKGKVAIFEDQCYITFSDFNWVDIDDYYDLKISLNYQCYDKHGCIKSKYSSHLFNSLKSTESALFEYFKMDYLKYEAKNEFFDSSQNSNNNIKLSNTELSNLYLIKSAGESLKKALDQRITGGALVLGGSLISIAGLSAVNSPTGYFVVGTIVGIVGLGYGISSMVWEYKAANYLIQVAPTGVKVKF